MQPSVWQRYYDSDAVRQTVAAGQTAPSINLTYGTITVRRYFYVAGGGTLSRPSLKATRWETPYSETSGYGSYTPTTEGQAIVTLLLPGTYTVEAFAYVDGSNTEFGTVDITVDEGDVVVIGGSDRPTVKVTDPTNEERVCGKKVTIEGTVTDDYGVASITINGEDVAFDPTADPVQFSHEVTLELGENVITIVVSDVDQTEPTVTTVTVTYTLQFSTVDGAGTFESILGVDGVGVGAVIPAPGAVTLGALGIGLLSWFRRRRGI